jgi:hypothetical protein
MIYYGKTLSSSGPKLTAVQINWLGSGMRVKETRFELGALKGAA